MKKVKELKKAEKQTNIQLEKQMCEDDYRNKSAQLTNELRVWREKVFKMQEIQKREESTKESTIEKLGKL